MGVVAAGAGAVPVVSGSVPPVVGAGAGGVAVSVRPGAGRVVLAVPPEESAVVVRCRGAEVTAGRGEGTVSGRLTCGAVPGVTGTV